MEESKTSGVPASVTLAQAVQEGGWGSSLLASKYYNFFGIKKHNWTGDTVLMWTTEYINGVSTKVQAEFRAYPNAVAGFADHSKFLLDNPRYNTALSKDNPYEFANELQAAGYATDPNYAYSLKKLIHDYNLTKYDPDGGINPATGSAWEDVGYVPSSNAGVLVGCGTADYSKFDAVLRHFDFTPEDVELIAAGIKEFDTSHTLLAGYNGEYGIEMSDTPLVGSETGDYVDVGPVQPGQMIWPTTAKYLTSNFGMRVNPVSGIYKLHKGIDIAPANSDTKDYPNIAAMDGLVIAAGDTNDGYGNKVVIDHGGGLETLYAHMKVGSLKVNVGQEVIAGTVLGTMGETGNAAGRHLHFEVYVNGKPTNPLAYVNKP
ncbi:glucosaminidase domain-containing protein [Paenibacillus tepidiphilus]|uniref:glucosaminidase domain-containing protein n=1 Tax=Paenibacillus tepidiphilus TaxID=2608683 RepID=UPI003B845B09